MARMRDALAGEMTRRQRVLRSAGNVLNVGEYRAARARGAELPALPALFVIVDEFSELLSQHPEFADLARNNGIEFHHLPVSKDTKEKQETQIRT